MVVAEVEVTKHLVILFLRLSCRSTRAIKVCASIMHHYTPVALEYLYVYSNQTECFMPTKVTVTTIIYMMIPHIKFLSVCNLPPHHMHQ